MPTNPPSTDYVPASVVTGDHGRQPNAATEQGGSLVVLGPLEVYAAKPYAYLPPAARAIELVPRSSILRWTWQDGHALPDAWGLRRALLRVPYGLRRFHPGVESIARRFLPAEVKGARAIVLTSPFQDHFSRLLSSKTLLYHVFDEYASYGWTDEVIQRREVRILESARHVIVVSDALARLYQDKYGVPSSHITVVPNGYEPAPPRPTPPDLTAMPAPRIGTIGKVNIRLSLDWVVRILDELPWATWTFVGDVTEDGPPDYERALTMLRRHPRCRFVGAKPYDELAAYAAAFDVAVFPFSNHLLNRASSPTRFFSQVPFGQPILATNECEQLVALRPLVQVYDSPEQIAAALRDLRDRQFRDGLETARMDFARSCTWQARSKQLAAALDAVAPAVGSR
jgi:glycosyltransferase involved in cell wall biosynthesis